MGKSIEINENFELECLGFEGPRTVQRLRHVLKSNCPHLVFFMGTKLVDKRMENVRRRCGFNFGIEVSASGLRGGLCLSWREDFDVQLCSYSRNHIDILISEDNGSNVWRYTRFYREPYADRRSETWNLLRRLGVGNNLSWLVSRDFNEILYSFEKEGGALRDERRMMAFREVLEDCELQDMGFMGSNFT